ncbi:cupin domain-containing protein [Colwellia sp. MB3u-70]|uniref:cupin domain-containing protein n=1 Tax=unclassified Colwellia TaxID=196834 RepID=UPI0015F65118|nr:MULTISPECIES: cupin domain-containing protein [unclassified Colwellia]MBA6293827.1 cupin domain-containing protein [Colwellia sp. MB3u-8]MBA6306775.1 cupin domain-containing protein [Colwellia sp. MB3u-70]
MGILDDFTQRAVVHSTSLDWLASPMPGVERRPLDRVGGEVARATSIVRYAKGSKFSPHVHTGGEEFVVLDGVFQDESGDFPIGSYVRNPPQSSHTPRSDNGCIIFVKLWQFQPEDRTHVRLQMNKMPAIPSQTVGVSITPLYKDKHEEVSVYYFEPNTKISLSVPEGAEVLVLAGELQAQNDLLQKHSWMRLPLGDTLTVTAKSNGAKIWLKRGNLSDVSKQIKRIQVAN